MTEFTPEAVADAGFGFGLFLSMLVWPYLTVCFRLGGDPTTWTQSAVLAMPIAVVAGVLMGLVHTAGTHVLMTGSDESTTDSTVALHYRPICWSHGHEWSDGMVVDCTRCGKLRNPVRLKEDYLIVGLVLGMVLGAAVAWGVRYLG